MSSKITRAINGKNEQVRPSFTHNHAAGHNWTNDEVVSEMAESLRNVAEDIHQQLLFLNNKQMLQCDVRTDIKKMRIALEKIARNTARRRPRKA